MYSEPNNDKGEAKVLADVQKVKKEENFKTQAEDFVLVNSYGVCLSMSVLFFRKKLRSRCLTSS